jgi:hypothetical protein
MQSKPTLKKPDPHDVFAIESLLAAHAEKSPPLAHDPAAADVTPQMKAAPTPQIHAPPSVGAPVSQLEPEFHITDWRDLEVDSVRPGEEIKVDALKPPGERPMSRWAKRMVMALLGLLAAIAAAGWQQYGEEAKAMAAEWTPSFVLAALPSSAKPAVADQPGATVPAVAAEQAIVAEPAAAAPAVAAPVQPDPASAAAAAAPADSAQVQSLARDLAAMGQQVEELKTTVAQLKASQAQLTRELAKASEARATEAKASETKAAAVAPPPPVMRPAAPPVRKPKPTAPSHSSAYSPAPMAAAPAAALPPVQATAPPPQRTIADDGEPVVRPPMPLR